MVQIVEMTNILGSMHKPRVDQEGVRVQKINIMLQDNHNFSEIEFSDCFSDYFYFISA